MEDKDAVVIEMTEHRSADESSNLELRTNGVDDDDDNKPLKADTKVDHPVADKAEGVSQQPTKKNLTEEELAEEKVLFETVTNGDLVALRKMHSEGVDLSKVNEQGNHLIHYAVRVGHVDVVAFLLEQQVDINATNPGGTSPLHLAAFSGFNEIVEMLCYNGAHVDHQDSSGNTALHFACQFNHLETSILLINLGSKLDITNSIGDIPLHGACRHGMQPVVSRMCELGCPINKANLHEETPLHLAAKSGNCETVRTLMLHGANLNKLNKNKKTPEDLATDQDVKNLFFLYDQIIQSGSPNKKFELRKQLASSDKPFSRLKIAVLGYSGVGKTSFIEALKCGFIKSFLMSSYYTISKSSKAAKQVAAAVTDPNRNFIINGAPKENYTKGVNIISTSISDIGDVMIQDFSGFESYYDHFGLFLGDSSTIHLIVISMKDSLEVRLQSIDFWLEFVKLRMSPKAPIGFAGCNMWAPNVFIIATDPDETNCSKNEKGEWSLKNENEFIDPLIEKYERDMIINQPIFVMEAQVPGSPKMKELKKLLSKLKTYMQNFLPTQMGCLEQTLLELPALRTNHASFPVVPFNVFADFVRSKVNLLASDDNIRELLMQLQLMGELTCLGSSPDEVIVLTLNWLGSEVIGRLFSYEVVHSCSSWSGFVPESFLKSVFQKFDFTKLMNLLKALNVCFERSVNNGKEYYIHYYNRTDFYTACDDWVEAWKSASLRSAVQIANVVPAQNQLSCIFSHVIVSLHAFFSGELCEFSQWKNACRVFDKDLTALVAMDNATGTLTVKCYSKNEDASKLFSFSEMVSAAIFSSVDQQCPGMCLQRLPASWENCQKAVLSPSFYKPEQILTSLLDSSENTIQLTENSPPESLLDVLAFGSKESFGKFILSMDAHVSCISYYGRCQLAWILDKNIELCQLLAQAMDVDENVVPIEPGTVSIFDRMMTYWGIDADITIRKLCKALKKCDANDALDSLLKLTPIFVYLPPLSVVQDI